MTTHAPTATRPTAPVPTDPAQRADVIARINGRITALIDAGLTYRAAARQVAAEEQLGNLAVRRLSRDHPHAP